jgi:hypothetical protein
LTNMSSLKAAALAPSDSETFMVALKPVWNQLLYRKWCVTSTGRTSRRLTMPPPAAVVFAETHLDVADAVALASQFGNTSDSLGVGTSLETAVQAASVCESRRAKCCGSTQNGGAAGRDAQATQ